MLGQKAYSTSYLGQKQMTLPEYLGHKSVNSDRKVSFVLKQTPKPQIRKSTIEK